MNNYQRKRINEALEYEEFLTEWESEFINNLADRDAYYGYELSEKENSILNKISEKVGEI